MNGTLETIICRGWTYVIEQRPNINFSLSSTVWNTPFLNQPDCTNGLWEKLDQKLARGFVLITNVFSLNNDKIERFARVYLCKLGLLFYCEFFGWRKYVPIKILHPAYSYLHSCVEGELYANWKFTFSFTLLFFCRSCPTIEILLYFAQDFFLHLITDCCRVW